MEASTLLLYLLSICIIIFLAVAIIFLVQLVKISRNVRSLSEKVDDAADNIVSVSSAFRKVATPLAVTGLLGKLAERFLHIKKIRRK